MDRIKKCFVFCWIKALSAPRAIAELWDVGQAVILGRNGRHPGEPIQFWPGSAPRTLGLVPTPSANGGHPILGSDSGSASYPVDDVHQARITQGVG